MAKAVKKEFVAEPPPYEVVLTLTQKEAETLMTILGRIGGCPYTSPRKFADRVYNSLDEIGVVNVYKSLIQGELMFSEIKKEE